MEQENITITAMMTDDDGSCVQYIMQPKTRRQALADLKEATASDGEDWGEDYSKVRTCGREVAVASLTEANITHLAMFEARGTDRHFTYQVFIK